MKTTISFISIAIFFVLLASCSKDGGGLNEPQTPTQTTASSSSVDTSQIGVTGMAIHSIFKDNSQVNNNGQFTTEVSKVGTQILFATDGDQKVRALTLSTVSSNQPTIMKIDASSTAYGLLFLVPGIGITNPDLTPGRIARLSRLTSFQNLVTHLQSNLKTSTLNTILSEQQTKDYIISAANEFLSFSGDSLGKKSILAADPDPYFSVTKYYQEVELKNFNWRFVRVIRRDVGFEAQENKVQTIRDFMPGGVPYSWGSILTFTEFQPTTKTDKTFGSVSSSTFKSEYWVIGPGRAQIEQPPATINTDVTDQALATVLIYVSFPLIDLVSGGTALLTNDIPTSCEKIIEAVDAVKTVPEVLITTAQMAGSPSEIDLASNMIDLSEICLDVLLKPPSILVTKFGMSFGTAEMLRTLLPFINASLGGANLAITAVRLWEAPAYSKYNIYTRIPHLLSLSSGSVDVSLTPRMNWDVVTTATNYKLQISEFSSFSHLLVNQNILASPQFYVPTGILNPNTKYYWRLSSYGNEGTSAWSEIWNFTTGIGSTTTMLSDNFDDGDFTNNPTWDLSPGGTGCWAPGTREVVNGEFHVRDMDSPGCGHQTMIESNLNMQVTDQTKVKFDLNPVFSDVRNGDGDAHYEYPAIVKLDLYDSNNKLLSLWFCYNYRGGVSTTTDTLKRVSFPNVPQNTWQRNQIFTLREYFPSAVRIGKIYIGAIGWDYEAYFDNISVGNLAYKSTAANNDALRR